MAPGAIQGLLLLSNVHGLSTNFFAGPILRHNAKPSANNRGPLVAGVKAWVYSYGISTNLCKNDPPTLSCGCSSKMRLVYNKKCGCEMNKKIVSGNVGK
jgi:hypothetical protein